MMTEAVDVDSVEPHRQLHQALEATCDQPHGSGRFYTRKHARTSSTDSVDYDWSSDVSGRFDDAESDYAPQPRSPSTHSAKRRRSNDWPAQHDQDPVRKENSSPRHRWLFHHHGKSSNSPRPSTRRQGRRSRFVEGSMNDSVSEKPPSIFFRDEPRSTTATGNAPTQRNSGIFRFGKAIASAFNPFGVWGNVSDIWKSPQEEKPSSPQNDALAQAEKAYAELKKSGYKGTIKGSYLQQQAQANSNHIADETWKAIQEKMDYKPTGRHSRQDSTETHGTGSSIRNSFQDLRKAKSSLGIASISILSSTNRRSDESDGNEVRRQKSRKELQRQAKLMKRVSNLEEKLERTRRELQVLMGDEEAPEQPDATLCQETPFTRKFVPGALPTLPSERLLQDDTASAPAAASPVVPSGPLDSLSDNVRRTPVQGQGNELHNATGKRPAKPKSPKQLTEDQTPGLAVDSPSRKRKSPDPQRAKAEPAEVPEDVHSVSDNEEDEPATENTPTPSRKAKLAKMVKADSPGSVERKWSKENLLLEKEKRSPSQKRGRRPTPPARMVGKRTPSSSPRKASNSQNTTPCLRMKKGRSDLRSASGGDGIPEDHPDKENQTGESTPRKMFLQEQHQLGPAQSMSSPSPSPSKSERAKYSYNYIPPVPPLPKDIAATAAKVDQRLAKEIERRRGKKTKGRAGQMQGSDAQFLWPEDIF